MNRQFDVEHVGPGHTLELYISPDCPYCQTAIAYYDRVKQSYVLHDAQNDLDLRARMFAYTGADPTVPAIVIDGIYVQSGWGTPPRG